MISTIMAGTWPRWEPDGLCLQAVRQRRLTTPHHQERIRGNDGRGAREEEEEYIPSDLCYA